MAVILDTRNGLGYSKTFQIQYEGLKNLRKDPNGFDLFVYFTKVPWTIAKVTWNYIAPENYWADKIEQMKQDYIRIGNSSTGEFIESVNVGERLIIDGEEHFSGSYSLSDYRNGIGTFPAIYNLFEYSTGNVSPAGYWDDNGRGTDGLFKKAFFNNPYFGKTATKTYTAETPDDTIGEKKTIAGLFGTISSVAQSNPRYINNILVHDYNVTLSADLGTRISF